MAIKPLADKVLLSHAEAEAVGPGTEENPMSVKVGDKVIITKYSGTEVKVDGVEYTIASVKDILAVIE